MDFFPDQETLSYWILHYGSISLFVLLALGVVALPIPDETLMVLAGIFMKKGDLPIPATLAASFLGSMAGITLSYVLGRTAGSHVLHKYGKFMGLTEERLNTVHNWFTRYGKWTLTFGYFVPGIRHFTGFAAGTSELEYPTFALFAYMGAAIWATVFLSIGYFLGDYWYHLIEIVENYMDYSFLGLLAGLGLLIFLWIKLRSK